MTIKKLSPDKVRITLSHEELAAYEIDWDHLGPDDEPTRELLLQLLDSAWQTAGFRPDEGQIYIEALPTENGCVLILSKAHASDTLESICTPVIFRFEHAEDLLAGARQLFQLYSHRIFRSSLYQCAGGCLLLIRPLDQTSQESVMLLAESRHSGCPRRAGCRCDPGTLSGPHRRKTLWSVCVRRSNGYFPAAAASRMDRIAAA